MPSTPPPSPWNAAVVFRNLADAALVSASSSLLLAPPGRVQNVHVGVKWRSQTADDHLLLDFGGMVEADSFCFPGVTATTARLRLSTTDPTGADGDAWSSSATAIDQNYRQPIWLRPAPVAFRYALLDLQNAAGAFVECGRAVAGVRSTYAYNYDYGWSITTVDPSVRTQTLGGQTRIEQRPIFRMADLSFGWVAASDRYGFVEQMERSAALRNDVLMLLNPASDRLERDSIWGLIETASPVVQPFPDIFTKAYQIRERL